jgi:hypothetical protein
MYADDILLLYLHMAFSACWRGSSPKILGGLVPTLHPIAGNPVPSGKSIKGNWGA